MSVTAKLVQIVDTPTCI